jgi:hypothetical protein
MVRKFKKLLIIPALIALTAVSALAASVVEVIVKYGDGTQQVFVQPALPTTNPTTQPSDPPPVVIPPVVIPPSSGSDAIEDAVKSSGKLSKEQLSALESFALSKGSYDIPSDAKPVQAGADLSKFSKGKYVLSDGTYGPAGDNRNGVELYAKNRGKAVVKGVKGKRSFGGSQIVAAGIDFDGGGLGEKLNDNSALAPRDGSRIVGNVVRNAVGVGVGVDGKNVQVVGNLVYGNGSAGVGGKIDSGVVAYNVAKDNNDRVEDRDGSTLGKFTRSNGSVFHHNLIFGGKFAGVWFDINNGPNQISDNVVVGIAKIGEAYEGVGVKLEINARDWKILRNRVEGQNGPAVVINETRQVQVVGNYLANGTGSERAVLHLRQLTRDDEKQKAVVYGDWQLRDVLFDQNVFLDGVGIVTKSEAGTKLTKQILDSWGVVFGSGNTGRLDVQIPGYQ